ncbi:hypothetical protein H4R20_002266 [Coemansia guatemalensis]|uniref:Amino acid transporter transmembrane domain-containing protein n=1 Tax=Coemansia guatemalensis TaxID=2761395 RepID=A0A9W8I2U0_9FUNG|nr:hypothetical protein H4R20_002266 [Coemansia guatemalensis]
MPVATFLKRVLNRGSSDPEDAPAANNSRVMTPIAEEAEVAAEIRAAGPVVALDDANQSNIYEVPSDFTETSSMDSSGKMPIEEDFQRTSDSEGVGEKDAVQDETMLESQVEQAIQVADPPLPRNAGFIRSFSNVVCIIIGTGCLQIPYAFAKTGWIGILIVVMSGFIGGYTGILTIRCLYYQGPTGHRLHSFPQIGRAAFGRWGQYATQFFNYLYSLGTTCLYIILSGQFIFQLVSTLGVTLSQKVWMVIVAIIMWLPVAILKEMSEAAVMAIFGLLASIVVIIVATVMSIAKPYTVMYPDQPAPGHDIAIGVGVPVALSSIVFSFAGSVVYPHVEASMRKPKQWPMVIFAAMIFCAVCYLLIGVAGYWAYGDQVVSPVLDSIPTGAPATVAKIMITAHVIIAAPIMLLSFYLEIEKQWQITPQRLGKKREFTVRLIYRSVVVAIVCGVSLAIPYFSDFLSLISSIACVTMYAIIPVVCYLKLYGHRVAPWYEKIWMVFVLAVGSVACIWGSIDAIKNLIKDAQGAAAA